MRDKRNIHWGILALLLVCGVLLSGAVRVQAATTIKASKISENSVLTLTDNTVLEMDEIRTLKSITGNYALTIKEVGPSGITHPLHMRPDVGHDAINVKSLRTENVVMTVNAGPVITADGIDLNGGDVAVLSGDYGMRVTGLNKVFSAINTKLYIRSYALGISAQGAINGTGGTWDVESTHSSAVRASATVTLKNVNVTADGDEMGLSSQGDMVINGGTINASGFNDAAISSANSKLVLSNTDVTADSDKNDGINVEDGVQVNSTKLQITANNGAGISVDGSYGDSKFEDSEVTIASGNEGISYYGSGGSGLEVSGTTLTIQAKGTGIYCESAVTVKSGTVSAISENDYGFFVDENITLKGGDVETSGKLDGVYCGKTLSVSGASLVAQTTSAASDGYQAIRVKTLSFDILQTFVRQPAGGKRKTVAGQQTITDPETEKPALMVEIVPADILKEIHFTIPVPVEGEEPSLEGFKITSVPANALKESEILKAYKDSAANSWVEATDKDHYSTMSKSSVFRKGYKYYQMLPNAMSLVLLMDMSFDSGTYYNRAVVQGIGSDTKIYVNGVESSKLDQVGGGFYVGDLIPGMKEAKIADIADQELSDQPAEPTPEVTYGGKTLTSGTDYTVSYEDNTKVGTAKLIVTGKGTYGGTQEKTFKIIHTKCVSDDGKVTKDATVSEKGVRTYSCKYCGKVLKTEEIPVLKADAPMSPDAAPTVEDAEKDIINITGNKDPELAKFNLIQAKAKKIKSTSVTLGWTKVKGAEGYIIYGNKCKKGNKYIKLTTVGKSKKSTTIKKIDGKKLKKGTYYKFIIAAVAKDSEGKDKMIAVSKSVHFITTGNKKYGDFTKVQLKTPKKITLKKGKKFTIRATQVKPTGKKVQQHRKLSYESTNVIIAKVSKSGKITAKKKGKCTIYVYAQNGLFAKVAVTVK